MKRKLLRRGASLLTAVALAIPLITVPAMADEPASFDMSVTTVRAGEATAISEIDPCPAPMGTFPWGNQVEVKFTDGLGNESLWSAIYDENGHWDRVIYMTPPHTRVLGYDPPSYSNDAWPGPGTVEVKCVEEGVTTLEYESQVLTVNGSSAGFTVSPKTVRAGRSIHLESVLPCPSGSASVDGWMNGYNMAWYEYQGTLNGSGNWSIDFTLPSDFPEGYASFNAFCRPPGNHEGQRTQAYAETFTTVKPDKFFYVGWGDSYSSGEGVEPFESGTDPGCHRSVDAYPRVLEEDSSLKLWLGDEFVACSGATTAGITLGDGTNPAQMDTLTVDTDLITMTIGGNNMPFDEFAEACAKPLQGNACTMNGSATNAAMSGIVNNVIPSMEYMLGTVRDRLITLDNTDATVLVLGYPQLVPETWQYYNDGCGWLQPDETPAIRDVTEHLNTAIKNEVDAIGYGFHFISATDAGSPFIGHELCRSTSDTTPSYFNNVVLGGPDAYTFHPNKAGHEEGYAMLVKNWLAVHPLNN